MKNTKYKKISGDKGFTLIEIMVAMAIMLVVTMAVLDVYNATSVSYSSQNKVAGMQQDVRAAMNLMVSEIRMAGFDVRPQKNGVFRMMTTNATEIAFTVDWDESGTLNDAVNDEEYLGYRLSDGKLQRGRYNGTSNAWDWTALVENVQALSFQYFAADGTTAATTPAAVRYVVATLTLQDTVKDLNAPVQRSLTTRIKCRNLGL